MAGNKERLKIVPYKLKLTYEAVDHWNEKRKDNMVWELRYDETIMKQAIAFLNYFKIGKMDFIPIHSEDYCFARAFNLINKEVGIKNWPSLIGHESNRPECMEKYLNYLEKNKKIDSKDHRVIQSLVMLALSENKDIKLKYPESVNKSWPEFWNFIDYARKNNF